MLKIILMFSLSFNMFFSNGSTNLLNGVNSKVRQDNTGLIEKMITASGSVAIDLDLNRLGGTGARTPMSGALRFDVERDSFFTAMVFSGELRATMPGSMAIIPLGSSANLPTKLNDSIRQLIIEKTAWGEAYELVIRDGKTGFTFFNIEGHEYSYDANGRALGINNGRLLVSDEFAAELGRPGDAGSIVGQISINATMRPIEVSRVVDGETVSDALTANDSPQPGTVPGPDVVVGDVTGLAQFGSSSGTQVGLAVGTDSCNYGTVDLDWFANPSNNHPVIPQNMYRMKGGADNTERLEQIGQSQVKHAFTALTQNLCGLGCNGVGGSRLGSGCSDPYSAGLNSGPNLGSKAWINPFTGAYPRNDSGSATANNNHAGHAHAGPTHRILTEISDLTAAQNPGATYYAEAQYVTPHEYVHCQANPTQCNMYNNVSYRRYNVTGTGSPFSFSPVGATVRVRAAINAWTGATLAEFRPEAGVDGIGIIGYKVTNPSAGVWHYEYAIYNQNIDRAIQSFSVPVNGGVSLTNIGFHAPPQHPGSAMDGTVGSAGFSNAAWSQSQSGGTMTWSTESFAQNPNANAIRWGTMYNFRFDSNLPPQTANATIGFLKTGSPITVQVKVPSDAPAATVSVSGQVKSRVGRGVYNARVSITDSNGNTRYAVTNAFGYYRFENVVSGAAYTVAVRSKSYTFAPQTLQINNSVTDLDFTAQ